MYEVDQLTVQIGSHVLLHGLTTAFPAGELCMVAGPNGAGKTTLLKCLDGEITCAQGNVNFNHKSVQQWSKKQLATMRAVLPQTSTLDFPFTLRDVVLMGRLPHETGEQDNNEIIDEVTTLCDCVHILDRAFPTLSGGEQQRAHTARVLAQVWRPHPYHDRFLLLDEPVSALDLSHQYALLKLLKSLAKKQNIGIICTLHNLNLAAQFADRCVILDQGRLVADGSPSEVFTEVTLSNVFDLDIWIKPHPEDASIPLIVPKLAH